MIYCFTWSEIPFCVGLLSFCMLLTLIIKPKEIKFRYFVLLGINSVFLFLCRYFGTFSLIIIGIFSCSIWAHICFLKNTELN